MGADPSEGRHGGMLGSAADVKEHFPQGVLRSNYLPSPFLNLGSAGAARAQPGRHCLRTVSCDQNGPCLDMTAPDSCLMACFSYLPSPLPVCRPDDDHGFGYSIIRSPYSLYSVYLRGTINLKAQDRKPLNHKLCDGKCPCQALPPREPTEEVMEDLRSQSLPRALGF